MFTPLCEVSDSGFTCNPEPMPVGPFSHRCQTQLVGSMQLGGQSPPQHWIWLKLGHTSNSSAVGTSDIYNALEDKEIQICVDMTL